MKRQHLVIALVLAILFVDQSLKIWVKTHMAVGDEIYLFGWEKARLHFVENPGMAFGMELKVDYGKLLLSLFRIVAVLFLMYYIRLLVRQGASHGILASFSAILAGALGNIIDSAFYGLIFSESDPFARNVAELFPAGGGYASFLHGKVVDMFYFPLWRGQWPEWVPQLGGQYAEFFRPVFNVADSAISIGVFSILLFQRDFFNSKSAAPASQPGTGAEAQKGE